MCKHFALLLLSLAIGCHPAAHEPEPVAEPPRALAANEQALVELVLLADGQCSLQGERMADAAFPAAYVDLLRSHRAELLPESPRRPTVTMVVVHSANTTWARLQPALIAHCEHSLGRFFLYERELIFQDCNDCERNEHDRSFAPIRIAREESAASVRERLRSAEGGMSLLHFQPTCSIEMIARVLQAHADARVPYVITLHAPTDSSLVLIRAYRGEEPPEEEYEDA